jgi:hypothetical protein
VVVVVEIVLRVGEDSWPEIKFGIDRGGRKKRKQQFLKQQ